MKFSDGQSEFLWVYNFTLLAKIRCTRKISVLQ